MDNFLSCDWGTSSFRLRLVDTATLQLLGEETSAQGIGNTFTAWEQTGQTDSAARITFYLAVIQEHIAALQSQVGYSLNGLPVLLSGMASSSVGLLNLPYQPLPFNTDGLGLQTSLLPPSPTFNHEVFIISGVQSAIDVMRGEETQLIGCISENNTAEAAVYLMPGTHSKHIRVQNRLVVSFKTYLTGELFDLLAHQSILKASVQKPSSPKNNLGSFREGVKAIQKTNFLHAAFLVRTNNLLGKLDKAENFDYLSGLLIGLELQDLLHESPVALYLLAGRGLRLYYETALQELGLGTQLHCFPEEVAEAAVIKGQYTIYKRLKQNT